MKKIQIYMEESMIDDLKNIAVLEERTYSEIIREAVKKRLKQKKQNKKPDWSELVKYATPMGNISTNVDDILYGEGE